MSRRKAKSKKARGPLRWRPNQIATWRDDRGLTQQAVSDYLAEQKPPIKLTRNSIGRIEAGEQMPKVEALEAMARLFRTDVTSMRDMTPEEAEDVLAFKALQPRERRRALRTYRAARDDTA